MRREEYQFARRNTRLSTIRPERRETSPLPSKRQIFLSPYDQGSRRIKFQDSHPERKITFFLFLLTLMAAAFFWLKTEFGNFWEGINKPATFEIFSSKHSPVLNPVPKPKSEEEVEAEVENLIKDLSGEYGVYIYSFGSKKDYGVNQDKVFPAASVNKVPIMLAFYRQLEKGNFLEDQEYELTKDDIEDYGTGVMRYEEPGKVYTYRELLELCGKKSDNTAAHVLTKTLGLKNIEEFIKNLGLEKTSIYGENNVTTAEEAGKLFVLTWEGGILKTEKYQEEFLDDLTKTDFEDRIPAGLPQGTKVAHKIGSEERAYHDCGLIFGSNPFVLCILSGQAAENEALAVIPKIAKLVWEFEER